MLFGQKQQFFSVNEIINSIIQSGEIKGRNGAVIIERREGRKVVNNATLYFRNEAIYAAEIKEKPIPIALRIWTGQKVDLQRLETIAKNCGSNSSPEIIRQVLKQNLTNSDTTDKYVKEHFLENICEIFAWENCKGVWVPNETTRDFTMPNASVAKLRSVVSSRSAKYTDFTKLLAPFFKASEVRNLVFLRGTNINAADFSPEVNAIITLANGENTVNDISEKTGIGKTHILQTVISLWEKEFIQIKFGAIELTYASAMAAHQKEEKKIEEPTYEVETIDLDTANKNSVAQESAEQQIEQVFDESLMTEDEIVLESQDSEQAEDEVQENTANEDEEVINNEDLGTQDKDIDLAKPEIDSVAVTTANETKKATVIEEPKTVEYDFTDEELHKKWEADINDIYSKFGLNHIDHIDFDDELEDSIEIDPLYLEHGTAEVPSDEFAFEDFDEINELQKFIDQTMKENSVSEELDDTSDKIEESDDEKIEDNSNQVVIEMAVDEEKIKEFMESEHEDNPTAEKTNVINPEDKVVIVIPDENEEIEEEDLELEEEIEVFEYEGGHLSKEAIHINDVEQKDIPMEMVSNDDQDSDEPSVNVQENEAEQTPESKTEEIIPSEEIKGLSFPDLLLLLEKLQKESEKLDREISENQEKQQTIELNINVVHETYQSVSLEAKKLEEECNSLIEVYNIKHKELENTYGKLDQQEKLVNKKSDESVANKEELKKLIDQKEKILDNVEEATSRFRVR